MKDNNNIHTDDKLICIQGNDYYAEGEIYTVGRIVNDKYFQLLTSVVVDFYNSAFELDLLQSTLVIPCSMVL